MSSLIPSLTPSLIHKYLKYFPEIYQDPKTEIISLGEGDTPLIQLLNLPRILNLELNIYIKYEGMNPTGSFKDRGMTAAVTAAKAMGTVNAIICASTGNTSAAASAYAARANLKSIVIIPSGNIARGKLVQAIVTGSKVIQIDGNFDDAMSLVKNLETKGEIVVVNSINPFRLHGQKTIAFEVCEQLNNQAPDYHCLPVGNAANIAAHWLGYKEFYQEKIIDKKPIMLGYQADGAAPFIYGRPVRNPETVATAIRIGNPQSWDKAQVTIQESQGWFEAVTDQEILAMQKLLAQQEGIFCEPASAASLAGLYKDYKNNKIKLHSTIVCTLTGHGLKDPDIILDNINFEKEIITIQPSLDQLLKFL